MIKPAIAVLLTVFSCAAQMPAVCAQSAPFTVLPSATDRAITSFDEPHVCWLPTSTPRDQLVVFLPGTNGAPRLQFPYLETASSLGYHAISLMYQDTLAAQSCMNDPNPDAYIKFRTAIIQGGVYPPKLSVGRADSIENRLQKVLVYLSFRQPKQGWNQFLGTDKQIIWSKIVITGQSQGGGHTYVVAKLHEVARAIMLGSPKDYSRYFNKPPTGFDGHTRTPLNRFFAFNHLQDAISGCNHDQQMQTLEQIGLTKYGVVDADKPPANYNHAHLLFTNMPVNSEKRGAAHGSVLGLQKSMTPQQKAVVTSAWRYMLTEPVK